MVLLPDDVHFYEDVRLFAWCANSPITLKRCAYLECPTPGWVAKDEALAEGRRAAELLPVTKDAMTGGELLRNLAIIYAWTGEEDLAITQLEELLPLYSPTSYGHLRLHPCRIHCVMIRVLKKSSMRRRNPSRFEELDLRLFEIARVPVRLDHVA